jgi:hypothetical protein
MQRGAEFSNRPHATKVTLGDPRPLLDEGRYIATCKETRLWWSRRWGKWQVRLVLEPCNYTGRPYSGQLCKFFQLGTRPEGPHAGPNSEFRSLWVEANGAQPLGPEVEWEIFNGMTFEITVGTVKDRKGKPFSPTAWYSVVREITRTHQHAYTPTHKPSNPLTLSSNTATPRHTYTPLPEAAAETTSLGREQQTHHTPGGGTGSNGSVLPANCFPTVSEKVSTQASRDEIASAERRMPECGICGNTAMFPNSDGTWFCGTCDKIVPLRKSGQNAVC